MADTYDFDILVIGAGSAGVRCSRVAAQLGAKVAVVENRYLGGTCVNVGCVPKKMMVYASQFPHDFSAAQGYGWHAAGGNIDWQEFKAKKDAEISRLNSVYESLLVKAGVTLIHGTAKIIDGHQVQVGEHIYSAKAIVIAVGGWPRLGAYPGSELALNSNDVFALAALPKSILIEGGGYIAVEFAGIFHGLGCETHLVYRGPLFMRGFEPAIREKLAETYKAKGIQLWFDTEIKDISRSNDHKLEVNDSQGRSHKVEAVLSAIGRDPLISGLGLENVAVQLNKQGAIAVNEQFQTTEPSIYALGDVVGRFPLTPVALAEGTALAHHLVQGKAVAMDYSTIPTAVFSQPELATVGLTSEQAQAKGFDVRVYSSEFKPLKHTISGLQEKTLMLMVVDNKTQRVLGCHMLGDYAAEMVQGIAIAVNMGATKQDFDNTIGIHPTSAEEWVTMR